MRFRRVFSLLAFCLLSLLDKSSVFDLAKRFRRERRKFAENSGEMALIFETGANGYFDERQFAVR